MSTRVTDAMMHNKSQSGINKARRTMIENQEKAITGKRIHKPSDDPVATVRALEIRQDNTRVETVLDNMTMGRSLIDLTDSSLAELSDVLVRAKELAIQASSYTNQADEGLTAVSKEVEQLMLRAVQIGNTRLGDRYIFGGYQTNRAPFDTQGNYFGDDGIIEIEADKGQRMPLNVPGSKIFLGVKNLPPEASDIRQNPQLDSQPTPTGAPNRTPSNEEGGSVREDASGVNIFAALQSFNSGLQAKDVSKIQHAVAEIDDAFKQVLENRATLGARQNVAEMNIGGLESAKGRNDVMISNLEDADAFETFSSLARNETSLEAALKSSEKIVTRSLLDFLR